MFYADIALPLPINQLFTYDVPSGTDLSIGVRVEVSFGSQKLIGLVVYVHNNPPKKKTKKIISVLDDTPLFSPLYLEWLQWGSRYYLTPLGEVLSTALPSVFFKRQENKNIHSIKKTRKSALFGHWVTQKEVALNANQQEVIDSLKQSLHKEEFSPSLLFGVTGSGKTEIYLHLIDSILKQGKEVILMVPEIGLTPQMVGRLLHLFSDKLALFHSRLTENQRYQEWMKAKKGEAPLVVGTRSSLFVPFDRLGAIIIDEEHDSSYKQEERFRYHARDLALVRGKMQKALVLMGSATPSLESFQNARQGKFAFHHLKARPQASLPPEIKLIDLSAQKRQTQSPRILCNELHEAIALRLQKKEQTLLLLNRRGFASSSFCLQCEKGIVCANCSVTLTYHKKTKKLLCHYCDASLPLPKSCPACGSLEMTLLGQGTETLEEELQTYFPGARVARLDRDSTQKKGVLLRTLKNFKEGEIDILVGTQMIAKGHDVFNVTLVGVVGIDAALGVPDFRASERTFQLLTQVAGRGGRGDKPGLVIVQAYAPKHDSIQLACTQNFEAFLEKEMAWRYELNYPPAGRLIQFKFSSSSEEQIKKFIKRLEVELAPMKKNALSGPVQILGPSPSPLEKLRGKFRWHLILKGKTVSPLRQTALMIQEKSVQMGTGTVKWSIDVDPINML